MTLAQLDALVQIENKGARATANRVGRDSRQWGTAADLLAFAGR